MFNKLVASQGKGRTSTNTTIVASVVVHALLIGGAVYASSQIPAVQEKAEEMVTFMKLKPEPPAPKPEAPPPPPPEQKVAKPPPPKGFQSLMPPLTPPPDIPDVTNAPPVDPKDFSGIGQRGGIDNGADNGVAQALARSDSSNFAYEPAVLGTQPHLENGGQLQSVMARLYPRMLQDAGISGSTMLQFVIEKDGSVDESTVKVVSTSNDQFADPSVKAIARAHFSPGLYKGKPVRVLVQIPITWKPAH